MALFKSQVLTQASGSVGGVTYTRSKGGLVMRARAVPTDPSTALQTAPRAALSSAASAYSSLAPTLRPAWELFAANMPAVNRLGDQIFLSGQNQFIRSKSIAEQLRNRLGLTLTWDEANAPTTYISPPFTTPTATADVSAGISINFNDTDAWANQSGAFMLVFQGKTCSAARSYFRGPWRLIGAIEGDLAGISSPAVFSPATLTALGYPLSAGNCCNISVSVMTADGRLSNRRKIVPVTIVP